MSRNSTTLKERLKNFTVITLGFDLQGDDHEIALVRNIRFAFAAKFLKNWTTTNESGKGF